MEWLEKLLKSLRMLYQGFLLRDIFGYIFPGSLVLGFLLFQYEDHINALIKKEILQNLLNLPYSNTIGIIFAIALSYFAGISIFAIGIVTGLLRYYPHRMRRLAFHLESVQFTSNHLIARFSETRERMVILLHTSGNIAIALFLCLLISKGNKLSYLLLLFGIAALVRHWETVYNLRSFQEAVLSTHDIEISGAHKKEDCIGRYFEIGGLLGLIFKGIDCLKLACAKNKDSSV